MRIYFEMADFKPASGISLAIYKIDTVELEYQYAGLRYEAALMPQSSTQSASSFYIRSA